MEWSRLMEVRSLRGQLVCRLPCCAFGQPIENTPSRGREHSLHSRIAEARWHPGVGPLAIAHVVQSFERQQSFARAVTNALEAAGRSPLPTGYADTRIAVARYFADSIANAA